MVDMNAIGGVQETAYEVGQNSETNPEKNMNVGRSVFEFADEDGKVDYGDVDWHHHLNTKSKYYKKIYNFLEKHLGEEWTAKLVSSFQKLIDLYNKDSAKDTKIYEYETTQEGSTRTTECNMYDKNGNKEESYVEKDNERTGEWDITTRDKDGNTKEQIRRRVLSNGVMVTETISVDENGNLHIEEESREQTWGY